MFPENPLPLISGHYLPDTLVQWFFLIISVWSNFHQKGTRLVFLIRINIQITV